MIARRLRRLSPAGPGPQPLRDFALCALGGLVLLAVAGPAALPAVPASAWAAACSLYAAGALAAGEYLRRSYPHPSLGLCNVVTLGRMVIVAGLAAPLVAGGSDAWAVFALAALALALDGVDGWLARRRGLASAFGARFDMEVDAALALVLALHALAAGAAGPLVLVLGLARYAFVLAGRLLPWLARPLPDRFGRKAVCVVQLGTLILLHLPGLPAVASAALVWAASGALLWSFGRDVLYLRRRRT